MPLRFQCCPSLANARPEAKVPVCPVNKSDALDPCNVHAPSQQVHGQTDDINLDRMLLGTIYHVILSRTAWNTKGQTTESCGRVTAQHRALGLACTHTSNQDVHSLYSLAIDVCRSFGDEVVARWLQRKH